MSIIAAKVLRIEPHPNADRLRVVYLDVGSAATDGQEFGPVVCGAFNFEVGAMVALALPGAEIKHNIHTPEHESFTLDKAKIRGVESNGMICAGFELGLSDEPGEGIMVLPKTEAPGKILY